MPGGSVMVTGEVSPDGNSITVAKITKGGEGW